MTIEEFRDRVSDIWELIDFCNNNDLYDFMSESLCLYTSDEYNEEINYYIEDSCRSYNWEELRDFLDGLPCGGDEYYHKNDYDEWETVGSYLYQDFMDMLIDYLRNDDFFEEEDDEEECGLSDEDRSECTAADFYKGYLKHTEDNGINILELYKEGK